jgi:hypothetical protein
MRFLFLLIISSLALHSVPAKAECTEVDLRDKMPPIRDQQDVGLCFAYAAANVLSFHTGQEISPLDIAYSYQLVMGKDYKTPSGGYAIDALTKALKGGLCLHSKFSDENKDDKNTLYQRLSDLDQKRWQRKMTISSFAPTNGSTHQQKNNLLSLEDSALKQLFPNEDTKELVGSMNFAQRDQVGQLVEKACAPRIQVSKDLKVKEYSSGSISADFSKTFDQVDQLLTDKKPSVITVMNFTDNPKVSHAMTLVGRTWNPLNQKCEYVIRNSWGTQCMLKISKDYRCTDFGKYAGDLKISREDLAKNLRMVTFLE